MERCFKNATYEAAIEESAHNISLVFAGLAADANGAGSANGIKIILWPCSGGANQRWSLCTS